MILPGIFNQAVYPEAGDVDDCWVVATVWAAIAADPTLRRPTVTEYRKHAGDPDDGIRDGGSHQEVMDGARGVWPDAQIVSFFEQMTEWPAFMAHLRDGGVASLALISGKLPVTHQYGFLGAHQVGIAYDGGLLIANPLAANGSAPRPIAESALRTAVAALGYIRAAIFERYPVGLRIQNIVEVEGTVTLLTDADLILIADPRIRERLPRGSRKGVDHIGTLHAPLDAHAGDRSTVYTTQHRGDQWALLKSQVDDERVQTEAAAVAAAIGRAVEPWRSWLTQAPK